MIQGDQHAPFVRADLEYEFIMRALETLVAYGHHIMAGDPKKLIAATTDVLVQLDLHSCHVAQRNRQNALPRHFGPVGDRRQDVGVRQLRVFSKQFRFRHSIGQEIQNERHPYAGAPDAGLSTTDLGVDGNAIEESMHG